LPLTSWPRFGADRTPSPDVRSGHPGLHSLDADCAPASCLRSSATPALGARPAPHGFCILNSQLQRARGSTFALPLNPSTTPDEITASSSEPVVDQMPVSLVATRFHLVEGMCKLKTCTHMGKCAATIQMSLARNQLRIRWLYVLWRQDFILSKASASWKTCSHMGKCAAHVSCGDKIFIVSGKCKLENLHPHGKRCRNGCVNCKSRGE